jgi:phosphatidylserine decarboxylase
VTASPRGLAPGLGARFALVRALPRKAVSRALGVLSRTPLPRPVLRRAIGAYVRAFDVDLSECDRPTSAFRTFGEFFARPLRPGARPVDPDPGAIVSPVDGRVHASGRLERGLVLPVKGAPYPLADLVGGAPEAIALEGGTFVTLYLAPRDYHRIHWPFDAQVLEARTLPGDLWPVDPKAVEGVRGLFVRNERVAVLGRAAHGPFALVPVGALNVGSIRLAFCGVRTNVAALGRRRSMRFRPPVEVAKGAPFGWFDFGSAVVLACGPGAGVLDALEPGTAVRVGRPIGRLRAGG